MFKKSKLNKNKINSVRDEDTDINLHDDDNATDKNIKTNKESDGGIIDLDKIKSEIDKKYKKSNRGILFKQLNKEDIIILPFKKEECRESTVKKVFVSEILLKEAKDPEEKKKLLGVKREEVDRIKEEKKKGLIEMQKELFSLPKYLEAHPTTKNDHVENLLKLSTAGLIEVPLNLEQKLKEESEIDKNDKMDNRLAEELDYLKVLKKIGPSYAKGYKSDISHKKLTKLNSVFENVFVAENSRKRKLFNEKVVAENRKMEEY